uniref:Transmembrane protein 45B n=1 Tax=Kalanchoe fedtschenkoi TaxID=63787 RepID=A0A7N0ZR24_KALFE
MGTFAGHILPGLALAFLGLWHTFSAVKAYYTSGSLNFSTRFWYPVGTGTGNKLRHLELVLIFIISVLAIVMQLFDYPFLRMAFKLDNFEHATIFLHLAVFSAVSLCAELAGLSDAVAGVVGVLAASVFGQELFLLHFHSTDHVGLEGHYHWILQLIVLASFLGAIGCTIHPTSFPSAIVLSTSVVLQGCWFAVMGFVLWAPGFAPRGCAADTSQDRGAVACETHEADARARALANMQFSWIVSAVLIVTACLCLKMAAKHWSRSSRSAEYQQLQVPAADNVQMATNVFKLYDV